MARQAAAIEGGTLSFSVTGEGPPVVLVSTLSGTWVRQIPRLRRNFTVITYDMRGFGGSASTTGFPSNTEHADDLGCLLDHLGIERAGIVGLSHGGLVAQHFAVRHPDRLDALGLVATCARPRNSTALFLDMLHGFLDRDDIENFWAVLRSFLFSARNQPPPRMERLLRQAMFDQYTSHSLKSIYGGAIAHDSTAWLGYIDCPTIVVGGQEDMLFPPSLVSELADLIPDSKLAILPAAHVPPVETPEEFNAVITEFLEHAR